MKHTGTRGRLMKKQKTGKSIIRAEEKFDVFRNKSLEDGTALGDHFRILNRPGIFISQGPLFGNPDDPWRERLKHFIHGMTCHFVILGLVILDLLIVCTGIILELQHLQSEVDDMHHTIEHCATHDTCIDKGHYGKDVYKDIEHILADISIGILGIFIIENLLILIAEGEEYFTNFRDMWWHWLDFSVVIVSFSLEIHFRNNNRIEAGLLIIARLWRIARVGEGVMQAEVVFHEWEHEHAKEMKRQSVMIEAKSSQSEKVDNADEQAVSTPKTKVLHADSAGSMVKIPDEFDEPENTNAL